MKTITLGTKITFSETGDKYSISEQTPTGFQFKPIRFEKGLPTVPRTFEEIKEEFLSSQIDIEGFEHTDTDNRLVDLIMDGYIKGTNISETTNTLSAVTNEKMGLDAKCSEQAQVISQHEATIQEQQKSIQEQKDYAQGQKDEITNLKVEIVNLRTSLEIAKKEHEDDKSNWESEKQKYEVTIDGLQAMAE